MSSIVTDVQSLRRPLPVGLRINTPVRRAARRGGMGRDHLLTKPEHGIISGHAPSIELFLAPSTMSAGALSEEKEDSVSLKDLLCLWFFFLSPIYNLCFPLVYKREGRAPH